LSLTPEAADRVMRVNFMAPMWTTLRALPAFLRAGGGTIVNVSSFAAKVCPPREGIYAASKAALNAFTAGLWSDLEGTGIHAGIVNPGPIDTPKRVREVTATRGNPQLVSAHLLRLVAPGLLLRGMAQMEPVAPATIEAAREQARRRL
jgi:short-subunit dehydrogenase